MDTVLRSRMNHANHWRNIRFLMIAGHGQGGVLRYHSVSAKDLRRLKGLALCSGPDWRIATREPPRISGALRRRSPLLWVGLQKEGKGGNRRQVALQIVILSHSELTFRARVSSYPFIKMPNHCIELSDAAPSPSSRMKSSMSDRGVGFGLLFIA